MHLQMRKKSWVEHRDHLGIPFEIYIIPVCRGTDQCKDTRMCLHEPEWQNTQLKICAVLKSGQALFFIYLFILYWCKKSAVRSGALWGWNGRRVAQNNTAISSISASHGDIATDVCEVERCSELTFCNPLHFFPMHRPLLCPQFRGYEKTQKFIFSLKINYVWDVLIIIRKLQGGLVFTR